MESIINQMCSNAIALFNNDKVQGTVKFHQCRGETETRVTIDLRGLTPYVTRAIHIHEYGDESEGCKSLGGHWNPTGETHGTWEIEGMPTHAGDMINNINPDGRGRFFACYDDPRIQIRGDERSSIVGRSVVIHDGEDDLGLGGNVDSLKTGNAGSRMACAIIGHARQITII